jgi:hypothetical protein
MAKKKGKIVQVKDKKTGHYVKYDQEKKKAIAHKKTPGPYNGIPIVETLVIGAVALSLIGELRRR